MQKRSVFHLPSGSVVSGGWARERDEGDRITMSIKAVTGNTIADQHESCLIIDNYAEAETFLETLGCVRKAYQESLRELWILDGAEVTIDTWPFLEPFIEVEGTSESVVRSVSEKLGFNWSNAYFGAVDGLYARKYGIPIERINNETPRLTFDIKNPFLE